MFSNEFLEEIFSSERLQNVPFSHLSNVIHTVENLMEEKRNVLSEQQFLQSVFTESATDISTTIPK